MDVMQEGQFLNGICFDTAKWCKIPIIINTSNMQDTVGGRDFF